MKTIKITLCLCLRTSCCLLRLLKNQEPTSVAEIFIVSNKLASVCHCLIVCDTTIKVTLFLENSSHLDMLDTKVNLLTTRVTIAFSMRKIRDLFFKNS